MPSLSHKTKPLKLPRAGTPGPGPATDIERIVLNAKTEMITSHLIS